MEERCQPMRTQNDAAWGTGSELAFRKLVTTLIINYLVQDWVSLGPTQYQAHCKYLSLLSSLFLFCCLGKRMLNLFFYTQNTLQIRCANILLILFHLTRKSGTQKKKRSNGASMLLKGKLCPLLYHHHIPSEHFRCLYSQVLRSPWINTSRNYILLANSNWRFLLWDSHVTSCWECEHE